MSAVRRFWPILLFALLGAIPLTLGGPIAPFSQIRQMAPWRGPTPASPWNVLHADGALQFYGWLDLVETGWRQGEIPFWNPYQLAGTPLLANSQSGALYPPHVALGVLHVPTEMSCEVLAGFHLFVAGLGAYWLSRRLRASRLGSAIAGIGFAMSPFTLAWAPLPSVGATVCWIPWLLGGIVLMFDEDAADLMARRGFVTTCVATAMMLLAGHLQFAAYGSTAAVGLAVWLAVARYRSVGAGPALARLALALAGLAIGFAVAAPQVFPALAYSQQSHRKNSPTEAGYRAYVSAALQPFELATLGDRFALGNPDQFAGDGSTPSYWPMFAKRGASEAESAACLGALVLALAAFAPWWRQRRSWPFAAISILALALALGTPLDRILYFELPGWSATGSPARALCLFVLGACVLAAVAATELEASPEPNKYLPFGPVVAALIPIALIRIVPTPDGMDAIVFGKFVADAAATSVPIAVGLAITAACLFVALRQPKVRWLAVIGLAAPVVFGWSTLHGDSPLATVPGPAHDRIAVVNDDWELATAAPAILPPDTATLSRIHDVGGYDSLLDRDTVAMLHDIDGRDPAPPANGNMMFVKSTFDPAELADAGVSEVWSRGPLSKMPQQPAKRDDGTFVYKLDGPGRVSCTGGPANIVSESLNTITISATGPGTLTLRDRHMPGLIAKVDGKNVPIGGSLWRSVNLPAGPHRVTFNYIAPGFRNGALTMLAGFGALAGVLAVWRPRKVIVQ